MRKYIFIILIAVLLIGVNIKKIAAAANIDRHTNSTLGIDLSVGIPIFYNDLSKSLSYQFISRRYWGNKIPVPYFKQFSNWTWTKVYV